jgi:hypothetical protein
MLLTHVLYVFAIILLTFFPLVSFFRCHFCELQNQVRVKEDVTLHYVCTKLSEHLQNINNVSFAEVHSHSFLSPSYFPMLTPTLFQLESATHMLYEFGEVVNVPREKTGALKKILSLFFTNEHVSRYPHRRIALEYLNICSRFKTFFEVQPDVRSASHLRPFFLRSLARFRTDHANCTGILPGQSRNLEQRCDNPVASLLPLLQPLCIILPQHQTEDRTLS